MPANWNDDSAKRWVANADQRDAVLAPIGEILLARAELRAGEHVLDVGCGCGATTIAAARSVGPDGEVVGLDLSEMMLDVARSRATRATTPNVSFVQGDAQVHRFESGRFDVAISRFGTMFFDDPVAAFTNIGSALRKHGRFCFATWQPLAENDWLAVPRAALLRHGTMPEPDAGPGMFSQSEPGAITATLEPAGFAAIDIAPVRVSLRLGATVDDAAHYLTETAPARAVLETIPIDQHPAALEAVRSVLSEHLDPSGVSLDGAVWITTARRS